MRPVDKGAPPTAYAKYQDAAQDLKERLGDYCSYCERQIETNLAVEHVQPKLHVHALLTSWTNFLLACTNCNSCKGHTPINLADYVWPDADNTMRAFQYTRGGIVQANPALAAASAAKAWATIGLIGLDRDPGNPGRAPTSADDRWRRRLEAWQNAERCRSRLAVRDTIELRETIAEVATGRGEFSIWWTVFAHDVDMRKRLREAFVGTHGASFDANENPLPRAGGHL